MVSRRMLLAGAAGSAGLAALGYFGTRMRVEAEEGPFPVVKTSAEWREQLTSEQYAVLREEATERPWSSELLDEHRTGVFHCAGCDNALYESSTKYDSRTGWPSFWDAIPGAVGTREDRSIFWMVRTEVHCARCGGHLGHVFEDGPEPTGLRHCINGAALVFRPTEGA